MGAYTIKRPKYFASFVCAAQNCESCCCKDWGRIAWTPEEYEKLCAARLPEEISGKIPETFEKTDEFYTIKLKNEKCPLLEENGLCSVQKTLGEEYLGSACRMYPRARSFSRGVLRESCYSSCIEVLKRLSLDENACDLDVRLVQINGASENFLCTKIEREDGVFAFKNEIFDLFYEILSSPARSIESSMALCELAARMLSAAEIPELPEATAVARAELIPIIGARPREFFLKNLAINMLFELRMPFIGENPSILENFIYFRECFSECAARFEAGGFSAAAEFARTFAHSKQLRQGI